MKNTKKMNTKNLMVSFCAVVLALFAVVTLVSAAGITNAYSVTVEGIDAYANDVSVIAGEEVTVKLYFTSLVDDTDVNVEATLEGEKVKFDAVSPVFDVETNKSYRQILTLKVPYELKDKISDDLTLSITLDGRNHKSDLADITLRVQRPSYNAVVKSITTPSSINAGEALSVDIVLKNMGYNDLDDVYVTVRLAELGIYQGPTWFGDLANLENCSEDCDVEDTVAGRLYLKVPYEARAGVYALEVVVINDDTRTTEVKQVVIGNDFSNNLIVTSAQKTVATGKTAEYKLVLVNPTDNVKVYTIASEADSDLSVNFDQTVIAVPAGSTKEITVTASSDKEGEYTFVVNAYSANKIVSTTSLDLTVEGKATNATVILTIVLAIIFLVLLVVLIVLLGKKPEKTEDFGESYY
jgi:hypothetical protein